MANKGSSSVGLVDASISSLSGSSQLLIAENNTRTGLLIMNIGSAGPAKGRSASARPCISGPCSRRGAVATRDDAMRDKVRGHVERFQQVERAAAANVTLAALASEAVAVKPA